MNTGLHDTRNQPGCATTNTCQCKSCLHKKILPTIMEEIMLELELPVAFDGTKFSIGQKDALRSQARRGREKISEWVNRCKRMNAGTNKKNCHIHHVVPLQYAHHFKRFNPNQNTNVLLLSHDQHKRIHRDLKAALANLPVGSWEFKKALAAFYRRIKQDPFYSSARVPARFGNKSILKELMEELSL